MTRYRLSAKPAKLWYSWIWMVGVLLVLFILLILASLHFAHFWQTHFPRHPALPLVVLLGSVGGALFSAFLLLIFPRTLRDRKTFELEVTPDGILRRWARLRDLFLRREEILGWIDRGSQGLMLVTNDPARHIFVPADLEDYADFRSKLVNMGVGAIDPGAKARFHGKLLLPNLVFVAALAGLWFLRDPLLIVATGVVVLVASYENSRRMRQLAQYSSRWGWLAAGLGMIEVRLLAILHYPPAATRFVFILDTLLFLLSLVDWFYSRLKRPRADRQ